MPLADVSEAQLPKIAEVIAPRTNLLAADRKHSFDEHQAEQERAPWVILAAALLSALGYFGIVFMPSRTLPRSAPAP